MLFASLIVFNYNKPYLVKIEKTAERTFLNRPFDCECGLVYSRPLFIRNSQGEFVVSVNLESSIRSSVTIITDLANLDIPGFDTHVLSHVVRHSEIYASRHGGIPSGRSGAGGVACPYRNEAVQS